MPTETFTSSYDPNEPSVTVTARMFIGSNEIANITKTFTESDFPPIEVDPCIIKIFGSANNTPAYTNHESEDSVFLFTGNISGAPGDITDEEYINTTEDELRVGFQTYLNSTDDRHGVQRSSYLNANTRGFVVLDIESPRNMVSLGDPGGFGQFGTREEEIEWFTQGVIKRINVIREFLPNAKIGVWRFAEGSNGAIQDRLQAHIDESVFAANVSYNGKTLYQTIDMFVSVLYQYFAEDGPDPEPAVYNRIVNGDRVDQALQVRDGIYNSFPLVQQKPTLALIAHQYEGGSRANQSATIPNSAEMTFAINRGLTNKFMIWYALPQEMGSNPNNPTSFESHKQDLLNNINTCEEPVDRRPMLVINFAAAGVSELDHWKVNGDPKDSSGNSILRKSNPDATSSSDDGIKYIVDEILDKSYQKGYRRFCLRTIMGARTGGNQRGNGVPSASWSIGDPNLGTWNDNTNIRNSPNFDFEYPFTSTGNLASEDSSAIIGDRQQSFRNFLKPWIDSKKEVDDPVDVYIYDGYQLAFFDKEQTQPARGNLAMTWQYDEPWIENTNNDQQHFPWPDFSNGSHVQYREGEVLPWRDEVGISGFVVDGASQAAQEDRPPGYFEFYSQRDLFVMGEAVPMINNSGVFTFDETVIEKVPYMGYYSNGDAGDFWGARRWDNKNPSQNSEIHIVLVWSFNGGDNGWSGRHLSNDSNVYDIASMKSEIDEMIDAGYVVSPGFSYYTSANPPNEAPAREEIINYIIDRQGSNPPTNEPILFVNSFGGLGNMPYPTHDSDGGNSFAGYARFDDVSINSDAITRSFLNSGTPKSTTGRKLSRTRTIDDDGYRSSYEAATTAVEKAELHANNSEDGVQHLINHYFEPGYKVGYRRFLYWTPSGNIAGNHTLFGNSHPDNHLNFSADWVVSGNTTKPGTFNQGRGMYPSTSWTAMGLQDPDGNDTVVTDSWAREMADLGYFNPIETGYKIPWTTNGYPEGWFESGGSFAFAWNTEGEGPDNWRSKDGQEKRSRQDSWKTFMKDWIDSKTELGDPVDFYIYNGGLVPYKSINGADETNPNGGDLNDIDWGNLGSVKFEGSAPNDAGGPSEGWINDGLITNSRFTTNRFSSLHPHRKFVQPRINPDGTWNSSGDQRFYEENYLPWISEVGIKGFWIDATADMIRTNPGQRQWFLNNGIEVGTEALDWAQTEFAAGSGLGAGRNRWFPRTNFLEMPYLALLNNGSTYAETRGWQNFNWKTGKMYVPRPDLGGIPQPNGNGSISKMTSDDATTVRGLEPGSGPEQDLVFFDGSPYDPSNPPEVYIWLIWGNGNPSVADSGWAAKHRLKDSSGNLIKRTTGPTTVPVGFELTTTHPNTFDRTLFDGDGSGFNEALGRYYNEFLMKQELDELIDKGYTPSNNLGNTDNTASGGIILNEGLNVEDYNIFARVQKYINARLSGLSSDDPEATKWLFLDIYDENGDIIITTSSV